MCANLAAQVSCLEIVARLNPMRKLVATSIDGASLQADLGSTAPNGAVAWAFRVMLGGRHPDFAAARLQDIQRIGSLCSPSITNDGSRLFTPLLRQKATHSAQPSPMPTAHKTAHQLAIRAFVDW